MTTFMDAVSQRIASIIKTLLIGSVVLSVFYTINRIDFSQYFPIKNVQVYGINRVDKQELQSLLDPLVNRGFFTVNVEYVRDRLLQMPWVAYTSVRRDWPDRLEIIVVEKTPIARWNDHSLLSEAGELFTPKQETYPAGLATFKGPEGKQILMLEYYKEINRLLVPLHARISTLELTPYSTWTLTLDNGVTLQAGHKDVLTRLDHFVKVYPKIVGNREADVEYVDLRYPNGVAIRWKTPPLNPSSVEE